MNVYKQTETNCKGYIKFIFILWDLYYKSHNACSFCAGTVLQNWGFREDFRIFVQLKDELQIVLKKSYNLKTWKIKCVETGHSKLES